MKFRTVADFASRFDAEMAAQELEVAEIPFIIRSDDSAIFGEGFGALTGAALMVPTDRLDEARAIIDALG